MALKIEVPAWGKEDDPAGGEPWDVQIKVTKDLACLQGVAFCIQGRYLVWGEIIEINEEHEILRVMYEERTGWLRLSEILDTVPHNELVMQQAGATASLAAMEWFEGRTPDRIQNLSMEAMVAEQKYTGMLKK